MTAYAEAQARLSDAKRRRDSRAVHAATEESKRLMTQQLRRKVEIRRGRPGPLRRWWGRGR